MLLQKKEKEKGPDTTYLSLVLGHDDSTNCHNSQLFCPNRPFKPDSLATYLVGDGKEVWGSVETAGGISKL